MHRNRNDLQRVLLALLVAISLSANRSALAALAETPKPQPDIVAPPENLRVLSRQLRVDLLWNQTPGVTYEIQRSKTFSGPFENLATESPNRAFKSDFHGDSSGDYFYRVRSVRPEKSPTGANTFTHSLWSPVMKGSPNKEDADALLTEVQEAGFRYFYDYGHPVSGLAREGFMRNPNVCAIGATGMGFFNLVVGIERGFITRKQGADRTLQMLEFLATKADRFHGAFPHWLDGTTGKTVPFSKYDDGADLVETSFLIQGAILVREYFSADQPTDAKIRALADKLWREVEWNWFEQKEGDTSHLLWHWSPNHGWKSDLKITGFNEAQSTYLLAMASPTHPITPACYRCGWEAAKHSKNPHTGFAASFELEKEKDFGPSLFFTHYSYLGFDPKKLSYGKTSYFDQFRNICRAQINYVSTKSDTYTGNGKLWGITSSYSPAGYTAFVPGHNDDGTLAPTAALSSMPYVPEQSLICLIEMYKQHGKKLWGPFGFYDAYNFKANWISNDFLGIDVGPIAPMIENYRTGLCWKIFTKAPEIEPVYKLLATPAQ